MKRSATFNAPRTAIFRMTVIRRHLLRGEWFNAVSMAGKLETSSKTVHRDIEFMVDSLGYQIRFDSASNGYVGHVPPTPVL